MISSFIWTISCDWFVAHVCFPHFSISVFARSLYFFFGFANSSLSRYSTQHSIDCILLPHPYAKLCGCISAQVGRAVALCYHSHIYDMYPVILPKSSTSSNLDQVRKGGGEGRGFVRVSGTSNLEHNHSHTVSLSENATRQHMHRQRYRRR